MASKLVEIIGGKLRYIDWPKEREAIEVGDAVISNEKIRKLLGWKPTYSLTDGLLKTKEYFINCKQKYL